MHTTDLCFRAGSNRGSEERENVGLQRGGSILRSLRSLLHTDLELLVPLESLAVRVSISRGPHSSRCQAAGASNAPLHSRRPGRGYPISSPGGRASRFPPRMMRSCRPLSPPGVCGGNIGGRGGGAQLVILTVFGRAREKAGTRMTQKKGMITDEESCFCGHPLFLCSPPATSTVDRRTWPS